MSEVPAVFTANECVLVVGGTIYGGWERIEVQSGIEQIAGQFALDVTTRWPGVDVPVGLREGLSCELRLGRDTVITGFVDEIEIECTDRSSKVRLQGRDKTGDLVDCSAIHKPGQWRNAKVEDIVRALAAPFGIAVTVDTDTGEPLKSFALEDGETAFAAIERAAKTRAVLVVSTPQGNLLITRASTVSSGVELVEGVNLKRFTATHTWRERYSSVTLKGQVPGDDDENGSNAAHRKESATDPEINRYRPLIVVAEHGTSSASLAERARWETLVRMGRGKRGRVTVVGWRTGKDGREGPLWRANTLVAIRSERMNLDMEMLIVSCTYSYTEEGQLTELIFCRPEAFELVEGIGRTALGKKIRDKTDRVKKRKDGEGFDPMWQLTPPNPRANAPTSTP